MFHRPLRLIFAAVALLVASPAWSQQPPAPAPAPAQPKYEAGALEVVLDLVVRDKKGRLIRDLEPKQIEVTEDGAPVTVRSFRMVQGGEEGKPAEAAKAAAPALDPLRQLRLVTLVFNNIGVDGKRFFRSAVNDLLKMSGEPNLYFSLYTIDQSLQLLMPFTNEHDRLKAEVERSQTAAYSYFSQRSIDNVGQLRETLNQLNATVAAMPQVDSAAARAAGGLTPAQSSAMVQAKMAQMQLDQMQYAASVERGVSERASLYALLALVREQAQLPGRKVVLFFTEWFTVSEPQVDIFRAIKSAANRANVAFYTVDAKGLVTSSQNDAGRAGVRDALNSSKDQLNSGSSGGAVRVDQVKASETAEAGLRANTQTALEELAKDTGGSLIAETNDLRTPLRKALEELHTYYEVAYTPQITAYDGKFRRLLVRIPSRPDLIVHARSGYFALPPGKPGEPAVLPYEMPLLNAIGQTPLPAGIDFHSAALRFAPGADVRQYTLAIDVPMRGIEFKPEADQKGALAHASLMALVKDERGEVVRKFSQDFPRRVPADKVELFKNGNLTQTFRIALAPGKYSLETAVVDRSTDKAGVKRTPIVVPAAGQGVSISSVTLIRRVDPTPKDADPDDPFLAKEGKIVPEYANTVMAGPGRLLSFYMVIYGVPGQTDPAVLNMTVYQNGQPLGGGDLPLPAPDKDGRIQYIASMPGDNFPAGDFEMRVTAKQAGQSAEDRLPFTVLR